VVRTIGYDSATGAPIQEVTARARVRFNPVILTTHSGVALLHDDVAEAARSACESIDPLDGDGACVRGAIESAQPQVTAAITRARSTETG
jgi:UrcA family protein